MSHLKPFPYCHFCNKYIEIYTHIHKNTVKFKQILGWHMKDPDLYCLTGHISFQLPYPVLSLIGHLTPDEYKQLCLSHTPSLRPSGPQYNIYSHYTVHLEISKSQITISRANRSWAAKIWIPVRWQQPQLWNSLLPITLALPIQSGREGMLWTPSVRRILNGGVQKESLL